MTDFITKTDVAILDEHTLKDREGKVVAEINERMLKQIAANNNRRVAETGDEVPIVVGHTKDDGREEEQPVIVGWARDFLVKHLGRTGRKAIFATFRILKDKLDLARKFPRRSVELWLKRLEIDPISLLGATTPERNLGLLRLGRVEQPVKILSPGSRPKRFSRMTDNVDEIVQKVLSALKETDVWKQLEAQTGDEPVEGDEPLMSDDPGGDDDMTGGGDSPMDGDEGMPPPPKKDYAMASGSNTHVPSMQYAGPGAEYGRKPHMPVRQSRQADAGDRVRFQREAEQARIAQRRAEDKATKLQRDVGDLQRKFRRADRERDLIQLEAEGFLLDRSEELQAVADQTDEQYSRHLDRIRHRYQRAPVGGSLSEVTRYARSGQSPRQERSREEVDRAIDYATRNHCSYEEALAAQTADTKVF